MLTRRGGKGTNSAQKNQLLFEGFGINYNDVPERVRKGSVIVREEVRNSLLSATPSVLMSANEVPTEDDLLDVKNRNKGKKRVLKRMAVLHCDLIGDKFWKEHQENWISTETACDSGVGSDMGGADSRV